MHADGLSQFANSSTAPHWTSGRSAQWRFGMAVRIGAAAVVLICSMAESLAQSPNGQPWTRHTIDSSSRGADGIRIADVNHDGLPDLTTGWEEGGRIRVYQNPGAELAASPWPSVTVGEVRSPEDAVFVDLDGDGATDVVSSCEGRTRTMYVHWGPTDPQHRLDDAAWRTEAIPATAQRQLWMFCLPMDVDGDGRVDLVTGSKGEGAAVGWLRAPENPRDLAGWTWQPLCDAGWIMSLIAEDMDGDGDLDILFSDRKGPSRGIKWLVNPRTRTSGSSDWEERLIGGNDHEVMFLVIADVNRDGLRDVVAATRDAGLLFARRLAGPEMRWQIHDVPLPNEVGTGKGIAVADVDLDGRHEFLVTCENSAQTTGVFYLRPVVEHSWTEWSAHQISGSAEGIKFDLIELLDLDADGDLDLLTCEERDNLGVIWYENPHGGH